MALRIKQIDPETPRLAPEEWDFRVGSAFIPEDREIYAWLHYEYARSYKPIIAKVEAIRKKQFKRVEFGFAQYLAQTFPQFPCKPWSQLPSSVIDSALGPGPIDEYRPPSQPVDIFEAYTIDDFFQNAADEQLGGHMHNYAAIQINFKRDDPAIVGQFQNWLAQRRRLLVSEHSKELEATGNLQTNQSLNRYLAEIRRAVVGRGSPKPLAISFMKRLGATRLLCAHKDNWQSAAEASVTPQSNKKGNEELYSDGKSWTRAKIEAGALLKLLSQSWTSGPGELQAGQNPLFTENNALALLTREGLNYADLKPGKRSKIVDFLTAKFCDPAR